MIKNPIQAIRNIWLVELLERNVDGLTLQEIIEEYHYRPPQLGNNVNPSQVSERTIHNWIKEVEENFHVKISCGKGKKTYNIENDDYWENTTLKEARTLKDVWGRIVVMSCQLHKKSGRTRYGELSLGFMQIGKSMLDGESVAIHYSKEHHMIAYNEPCIFKPFYIKVIDNECYVIGEIRPVSGLWNERIEVYSMDRLSLIEDGNIPVENYTIPYDFTLTDYFRDSSSLPSYLEKYVNKPMAVFLNAHNETADYLREHPISPTQTEIESNRTNNKNIFMVVVKPNEDFFTQILSFGEDLTITNPDFLKREGEVENGELEKPFRYRHQRHEEDLIGYDYFHMNSLNVMKRKGIGENRLLQSKYGKLSDAELVAKYQQGDERCFDALYEKYYNRTLGYLQNLTSDNETARHLNSITWENVYVTLLKGQYHDSGKFENWVKVIAKNNFRDWYEEQKSVLPPASFDYEDRVFQGVDEGPERALEKKENSEVLKRIIADLPEKLRVVLELFLQGYSYGEIAKELGETKNTIERRFNCAVRVLRGMVH